jgi:4-hydroxy-3-polyprenylbenzoate decarboxylase
VSSEEAHSYRAGKVIYCCLLGDRFAPGERPVKGSFENGWPSEIQQRVLERWNEYGYAGAEVSAGGA